MGNLGEWMDDESDTGNNVEDITFRITSVQFAAQ